MLEGQGDGLGPWTGDLRCAVRCSTCDSDATTDEEVEEWVEEYEVLEAVSELDLGVGQVFNQPRFCRLVSRQVENQPHK